MTLLALLRAVASAGNSGIAKNAERDCDQAGIGDRLVKLGTSTKSGPPRRRRRLVQQDVGSFDPPGCRRFDASRNSKCRNPSSLHCG